MATRPDGACALHALVGSFSNGEIVFLPEEAKGHEIGINAKKDFLSKLNGKHKFQELLIECFYEFLSYSGMEEWKNKHIQFMKPINEQISHSKDALIKIYQNALSSKYYKRLFHFLKESKEEYTKKSEINLKESLLGNKLECFNAFSACFENICPLLENLDGFTIAYETFETNQLKFNKKQAEFFISESFFNQYEESLLKPYYHLSDIELKLATYLYDKKVILFSEGQEPQIFNEKEQDCVFIQHEGDQDFGHYSRLSELPKGQQP